jgi:hypothetical protein
MVLKTIVIGDRTFLIISDEYYIEKINEIVDFPLKRLSIFDVLSEYIDESAIREISNDWIYEIRDEDYKYVLATLGIKLDIKTLYSVPSVERSPLVEEEYSSPMRRVGSPTPKFSAGRTPRRSPRRSPRTPKGSPPVLENIDVNRKYKRKTSPSSSSMKTVSSLSPRSERNRTPTSSLSPSSSSIKSASCLSPRSERNRTPTSSLSPSFLDNQEIYDMDDLKTLYIHKNRSSNDDMERVMRREGLDENGTKQKLGEALSDPNIILESNKVLIIATLEDYRDSNVSYNVMFTNSSMVLFSLIETTELSKIPDMDRHYFHNTFLNGDSTYYNYYDIIESEIDILVGETRNKYLSPNYIKSNNPDLRVIHSIFLVDFHGSSPQLLKKPTPTSSSSRKFSNNNFVTSPFKNSSSNIDSFSTTKSTPTTPTHSPISEYFSPPKDNFEGFLDKANTPKNLTPSSNLSSNDSSSSSSHFVPLENITRKFQKKPINQRKTPSPRGRTPTRNMTSSDIIPSPDSTSNSECEKYGLHVILEDINNAESIQIGNKIISASDISNKSARLDTNQVGSIRGAGEFMYNRTKYYLHYTIHAGWIAIPANKIQQVELRC